MPKACVDLCCTCREANNYFDKVVEENAEVNNKRSPLSYCRCAQQREISYIPMMLSSVALQD